MHKISGINNEIEYVESWYARLRPSERASSDATISNMQVFLH